jgi:hypothetical protein
MRMATPDDERSRNFECQDGGEGALKDMLRKRQRMVHSPSNRLAGSMEEVEELIHGWQSTIQELRRMQPHQVRQPSGEDRFHACEEPGTTLKLRRNNL